MCRKSIFLVMVLAVHNLEAILQLKITPDIVFEGDRVTLQYTIYKTKVPPTKEVTWKHNGQEFNATQDPLNFPRTFLIDNVSLDDAGTYTCSNDLYESTASLIVIKPTRIVNSSVNWSANYEVKAEDSVTLRCDVETDERLEYEIKWFKGENTKEPIANTSQFVITDDSLTISNVTTSDIGDYICEVKTVIDTQRATTELTLEEVPHAPVLSEFKCTGKSAEISWKPSENYGPEIESYKIEQNIAFDPDNWSRAAIVSADTSKMIIRLNPWTNYTFRVIATNKIGASPPSQQTEYCVSDPDVPYKNPENVTGKGTKPTNLVISWSLMPQTEHNGPGFSYRVSWKRDIPNENWITRDVLDWQQENITVNDQPTFVKFLIKVEAFNSIGKSNAKAVEIIGSSGEGIPKISPSNLKSMAIKSTSAILSWDEVPVKDVNGYFNGYEVQIWNDIDGKDNNLTALLFQNQYEFTNLRPATRYHAQVCVVNSQFDGPFSSIFEFDTAEGVPSIVQSFKISASKSSTLTLKWTQPKQPNGNLTGYNIYCEEAALKQQQKPVLTVNALASEATVKDLKPNTKYRLHIAATTAAGEGERASIEAKTQPAEADSSAIASPVNTDSDSSSTDPPATTESGSSSTVTTKPNSSSSISGNVSLVITLVATMVAAATTAF